jgi:hypothetical protein
LFHLEQLALLMTYFLSLKQRHHAF